MFVSRYAREVVEETHEFWKRLIHGESCISPEQSMLLYMARFREGGGGWAEKRFRPRLGIFHFTARSLFCCALCLRNGCCLTEKGAAAVV